MNRIRATAVIAAFAAGALALTACGSSSSSTRRFVQHGQRRGGSGQRRQRLARVASSAPGGIERIRGGGARALRSASTRRDPAAAPGRSPSARPTSRRSVLLADIYGDALKAKGVNVTYKPKIGSREVYIPALKDGSIDMVPEYAARLLAYFDPKSTAASSEDIYKALPAADRA